ncbi:MAG: hypothetical protein AABZ57_03515 [Candidatus Margulisiibacteriota bacterium]
MPSYIGRSSREGSGVFDPVKKSGCEFEFYPVKKDVSIDTDDLILRIRKNKGQVLFLIGYFGFRDPKTDMIKKEARKNGMIIIDDLAHSFFTFLRDPAIDFDHGLVSFHKLFPADKGGAVISKQKRTLKTKQSFDLGAYNINGIIAKRRENYDVLLDRMKHLAKKHDIKILRGDLKDSVPQTFPILLKDEETRDRLYFGLNEKGYGAVSLYHELIGEIPGAFKDAHWVSKRILNLPVHQDADQRSLEKMIKTLGGLL